MLRVPGLGSVVGVVLLPASVATAAVREAADVVAQARATLAAVHRVATRLDGVLDELEQPLRDLAPGLRRLAEVLDDPVVAEVPEALRRVQADLLPVLRTLAETSERVSGLAGLPVGLLRRRPPGPTTTVVVSD